MTRLAFYLPRSCWDGGPGWAQTPRRNEAMGVTILPAWGVGGEPRWGQNTHNHKTTHNYRTLQ